MKVQYRFNTFETNSSLSHSLQLMSKAEFDDLMAKDESDDWVWDEWKEKWVNVNSAEFESCGDYRDSYFDEEAYYEIEEYTTPSGEVVVGISRAKNDY